MVPVPFKGGARRARGDGGGVVLGAGRRGSCLIISVCLLSNGAVPARTRRRGSRRRARVRRADLAVELREQVGVALLVQLAPVDELPRMSVFFAAESITRESRCSTRASAMTADAQ